MCGAIAISAMGPKAIISKSVAASRREAACRHLEAIRQREGRERASKAH